MDDDLIAGRGVSSALDFAQGHAAVAREAPGVEVVHGAVGHEDGPDLLLT